MALDGGWIALRALVVTSMAFWESLSCTYLAMRSLYLIKTYKSSNLQTFTLLLTLCYELHSPCQHVLAHRSHYHYTSVHAIRLPTLRQYHPDLVTTLSTGRALPPIFTAPSAPEFRTKSPRAGCDAAQAWPTLGLYHRPLIHTDLNSPINHMICRTIHVPSPQKNTNPTFGHNNNAPPSGVPACMHMHDIELESYGPCLPCHCPERGT